MADSLFSGASDISKPFGKKVPPEFRFELESLCRNICPSLTAVNTANLRPPTVHEPAGSAKNARGKGLESPGKN
jgi:hypothetical protein